MCKYHIDTSNLLETFIPKEYKRFGGGLGVRKKENVRPIIPIGQDECTFHQFTFSKKYWKGPMGENILFPKAMGEMYMISGYQAREFGLGLGYLYTEEVGKSKCREKRKMFCVRGRCKNSKGK